MLIHLEINNVALIDSVSIDFESGLNVLTGETGAGKSILIDSINAVLGERISKELIRTGREKAVVEALFQVENDRFHDIYEELGIDSEPDGSLIISREFNTAGRNICRINGKIVTVSMLKDIGQRIIDIHGQHDNQSLLRTESHASLLDSFGGESIQLLKNQYTCLLEKYKTIKNKLKELTGDKSERERKIDLLKYQIEEIKKSRLKVGEEEELEKQRLLLANSEKITEALSKSYDALFSGSQSDSSAADKIGEAISELNTILKINEKYKEISQKLEDISYQLDDVIEEIRSERDGMEYNPEMLEQIEERLDIIFKLKRKYGAAIKDILEYCRKIETELDEIVKSEETVKALRQEIDKIDGELYSAAKAIHSERLRAAGLLEKNIGCELDDLEMKKAKFKVNIEFTEDLQNGSERKYTHNGLDKIEFLISPNAGEPLKPLSKIASGGEMSRIMLAIKTILADVDEMPTLIFDEIDIGISGKAAQKVGEKLSFISKSHQVICVTHLAQIACMADNHYLIEKVSDENNTHTMVNKLGNLQMKEEIARILGGANISEITIKHAEEMLLNASDFKKNLNIGK